MFFEKVINRSFSAPISDDLANIETNGGNGFNELLELAVNFTSKWAPVAILDGNTRLGSTDSNDIVVQLVECHSSVDCFNWINYTQNKSNRSSINSALLDNITETVHSISSATATATATSIELSTLPTHTLDNQTLLSSTISTLFATELSNTTPRVTTFIIEPDLRVHHPILAVILAIICVIVVFGNTLTMLSVYRERYLHTVTNYFVASLAAADCLVGAIVMPFSVVHEVMNKWWIFGQNWCDLWHSFDVLASSASILNLCVISLDRYWAITDPITYPSRMTPNKAAIFIASLWLCSALISFPAILWWRAVEKEPPPVFRCLFTDDVGYLVFSSTISFYGPLTVMVFTYYRIYVVASKQTRSLKLGAKQIQSSCESGDTNALTLRIHRGGKNIQTPNAYTAKIKFSSDSSSSDEPSIHLHPLHHLHHHHTEFLNSGENGLEDKISSIRSARNMKANLSVGKRLAKLAKERKAAKTLGIVMGVFILCWLPFFVTNVLMGICAKSCIFDTDLVFSIVTWLGWLNSAMNPAIYACWSKDFRRAFRKILCSCCANANRRSNANHNRFSYCAKLTKIPATTATARKCEDEIEKC